MKNKIMNIDEFINQHIHICYCEAILFKDGRIAYAIPSHQQFLIKYYCQEKGITEKELIKLIPTTDSPNEFILKKLNAVSIYYEHIEISNKKNILNIKQRISIDKLVHANIVSDLVYDNIRENFASKYIPNYYLLNI